MARWFAPFDAPQHKPLRSLLACVFAGVRRPITVLIYDKASLAIPLQVTRWPVVE